MLNRYFIFLCLFVFNTFNLNAHIEEVSHFKEIEDWMTEGTFVILDIDDTLLVPVQMLGSDVWFCDRWSELKEQLSFEESLDQALAEWEAVRHLTKMKLVEPDTHEVVSRLQRNHTVMGLTTQGLALATRTKQQLRKEGIDLSRSAPHDEDVYFINQHGVLYREGILFTSGTPKGPALMTLLERIDVHPKRIVFINDKSTHLRDVEKSVLEAGIEFVGLRYGFSDDRVQNYSRVIADIQWNQSSFGHILSDEEAESLLHGVAN